MKLITPFKILMICVLGQIALFAGTGKSVAKVKCERGEQSLKLLQEGNGRYLSGKMTSENSIARKREIAQAVHEPIAVILGCSDARIPPEIIFDQTVGDLFVVRVIGNIAGTLQFDSIEYASHILNAPLIVVLGHESCGAVRAVLEGTAKEEDEEHIIPFIEPAIQETKGKPGDHLTNAIRANVDFAVNMLSSSKVLAPLIKGGKLKIVGGYYSLKTGKVEFFESPGTPTARHIKEPLP